MQDVLLPLAPPHATLADAGVDEVGRGCWAGPVAACAIILKDDALFPYFRDSKKLTAQKREALHDAIVESGAEIGYALASAEEIDDMNILQASFLAMRRAIENLSRPPAALFIDGKLLPKTPFPYPATAVVGGDDVIPQISAASIIAKVRRDALMREPAEQYPEYGFERNAGYGVRARRAALRAHGLTPVHRKSFKIRL